VLNRRFDREILALALPALGTLAADPLVTLVDTAFVGRLGREALAALGVNAAVFSTSFFLFIFLAYGTTPMVGRAIGRGDPDAAAPLASSPEALAYPEVGRLDLPSFWGGHTAMPLLDVAIPDYAGNRDHATRDFLFVVSESVGNACQETRHVTLMLDITDEAHPLPISTFQVPESSGGFCARGGRFGPHAPQWSMEPPFYGKLMVVSWFNAGARVIDVRDPFDLREVAYYIPATTERTAERCATIDGVETCGVAIQTNNVEVDDRGLIYLVDRADTGLHIVELTGPAAAIIAD